MACGGRSRLLVRLLTRSVRQLQTTAGRPQTTPSVRVKLVAGTAASAVVGYLTYNVVTTSSPTPSAASTVSAAKVRFVRRVTYLSADPFIIIYYWSLGKCG